MMKQRLQLAKNLLKEDGIIFVSIDDTEHAYLKVLMDEIFGEENFVTNFIWQKKSGGGQAKYIYEGHEYICLYSKNKNLINGKLGVLTNRENRDILKDKNGNSYYLETDYIRKEFGKKSKDTNHRNCFYEELQDWKDAETIKNIEEKIRNGDLELVWSEKMKMHFIAKRMYLINNSYIWTIPYSLIQGIWTSDGNNELDSIMNSHLFENPKPKNLLKILLNMNKNKNSLILDFFAGSGTTGHAVMELNREDGGNRKFILCTNNENNIAYNITYERLYRIIQGKGTRGESFNWINDNLPYSNEKIRIIKIDDTNKIDLENIDENNDLENIINNALNGIKLIDNSYDKNKNQLDIYYDLAALNPLDEE